MTSLLPPFACTRAQLIRILEKCINITAIENGYADQFGLPFYLSRNKNKETRP